MQQQFFAHGSYSSILNAKMLLSIIPNAQFCAVRAMDGSPFLVKICNPFGKTEEMGFVDQNSST